MLYHAINRLEKEYSFFNFNKKPLSPDELLVWLETLGILALPDKEISSAILLKDKRFKKVKGILLYNPHLYPDLLTLTLGHELGHILLGHFEFSEVLFSGQSFFSKTGIEKDAGIIGFLCWVPTPFLVKLEREERLSADELAWELLNCDSEHNLLYKACQVRIRIYYALKWLWQPGLKCKN